MVARSLAVILCLGWAFPAQLWALPLPDDRPKRGPIDAATIAAYEKLGAEFGGLHTLPSGRSKFEPGKEAAAKYLPEFRFSLPKGELPGRCRRLEFSSDLTSARQS